MVIELHRAPPQHVRGGAAAAGLPTSGPPRSLPPAHYTMPSGPPPQHPSQEVGIFKKLSEYIG